MNRAFNVHLTVTLPEHDGRFYEDAGIAIGAPVGDDRAATRRVSTSGTRGRTRR